MKLTLKEWREKRKMSQTELAELIGKSQVTVSHWETGKTVPTKIKDVKNLRRVLALKQRDSILMPDESTLI